MTMTPHPLRGQAARLEALRDVLRPLNTSAMETGEVVRICEDAVPDASIDDIVAALRQTAAEHMTDADQLQAQRNSGGAAA